MRRVTDFLLRFALFACLLLGLQEGWGQRAHALEGAPPPSHPLDRYNILWERSPFSARTVVAMETRSFADEYALAATAKIGEDFLVTLINKTTGERILVDRLESPQGLRVVSISDSGDIRTTAVTLAKGNEQGVVRFDPALIASLAPNGNMEPPSPDANPHPSVSPQIPTPPEGRVRRRIIPSRPPGQ